MIKTPNMNARFIFLNQQIIVTLEVSYSIIWNWIIVIQVINNCIAEPLGQLINLCIKKSNGFWIVKNAQIEHIYKTYASLA